MNTYSSNDLNEVKSQLRELRAVMNEGFRTANATINAIKARQDEEKCAEERKEYRRMMIFTILACAMWVIGLFSLAL